MEHEDVPERKLRQLELSVVEQHVNEILVNFTINEETDSLPIGWHVPPKIGEDEDEQVAVVKLSFERGSWEA